MKFRTNGKRRFFSLIEIIVVLIVIAIVSGVFVINIRGLWRQQAFLDESNLLLNQLRLAQDMMQVMDTDVQVHFTSSDGSYASKIVAISQPPALGKSIAERSGLSLSAIGPLFFEDINGKVLENEFELTFFSRGFLMNHGVLKFGPKGAKEPTLAIAFPGYLQPFVLQSANSYSVLPDLKEQRQIERITEITRQEIDFQKEPEIGVEQEEAALPKNSVKEDNESTED